MHIPGINLAQNTVSAIRRDARIGLLYRRRPNLFVLHGVEVELGSWATDAVRYQTYTGIYEDHERSVVQRTVRSDDVILEIGCGSGYMTTFAGRRAASVRSFDANPAMVSVARATVARNGVDVTVENAVLERNPTRETVAFYVQPEFLISSLVPDQEAQRVDVPVIDFLEQLRGCSYLLVDIEGAETTLLRGELPGIRAICVECHPNASTAAQITGMLSSLFAEGFVLDLLNSEENVIFLWR
jgi:FkbM family methyltransferase